MKAGYPYKLETREERRARREREGAKMWEDAATRMPRIVRLTAKEAKLLDPGTHPERNRAANWCTQCGHLPTFHTIGTMESFCTVDGCECSTEDWDAKNHAEWDEEERSQLMHRAYSSWRWAAPLLAIAIGIAVGRFLL